jgi:hypothetical protein
VNYFQKEDQVTVKEDQVARHVRLRQLPGLMKIRFREAFHFFCFYGLSFFLTYFSFVSLQKEEKIKKILFLYSFFCIRPVWRTRGTFDI